MRQARSAWPLWKRLALGVGIALAVWLAQAGPAGRLLEEKGLDLLFLLRGPLATPDDLVLVAVDDPSFSELHLQWPWPRSLHGRLIDRLHKAGARVIALDILFAEPSAPLEDDALIASVARAGNVVLASDVRLVETTTVQQILHVSPLPALRQAAAGVGVVNQLLDEDGVIRRARLVLADEPSFAAEVARVAGSPASSRDRLIGINYTGPSPAIRTVSYAQALSDSDVPDSTFAGRIVFVGRALGPAGRPVDDAYYTPYFLKGRRQTPGVEVHAAIVDTLLRHRPIVHVRPSLNLAWTVVWPLGVLIVARRIGPWTGLLATLGMGTAQGVCALVVFSATNVWIAWVTPLLAGGLVYGVTALSGWRRTRSERQFIRRAFQHYVHPAVVQAIIDEPARLTLGGESADATTLFSDLQGFTRIAEGMSPPALVGFLNRYFTVMTEAILAHRGMINQTMGDGILALWGVPLPNRGHAVDACRAALMMQQRLTRLNQEWTAQGWPTLRMRIGIQTGEIVVGNIGSTERFSYGALGDNVNLASRLEGVNKLYGTGIIISGDTASRFGDEFVLRELDIIRVVGRIEPLTIYECVGARGEVSPAVTDVLGGFATGLAAYRQRDWTTALARFEHVLCTAPDDGPSRLYAERTREFLVQPPPTDWDGVYTARTKDG